jgi:hypothetical protein
MATLAACLPVADVVDQCRACIVSGYAHVETVIVTGKLFWEQSLLLVGRRGM